MAQLTNLMAVRIVILYSVFVGMLIARASTAPSRTTRWKNSVHVALKGNDANAPWTAESEEHRQRKMKEEDGVLWYEQVNLDSINGIFKQDQDGGFHETVTNFANERAFLHDKLMKNVTLHKENKSQATEGRISASTPCTLSYLQKYMVSTGTFPQGGTWNGDFWSPSTCSLKTRTLTSAEIGQCLKRKNIKKIAIFGDSQSMRYTPTLVKMMNGTAYNCRTTKEENIGLRTPDPKFFSPLFNPKIFKLGDRDCDGCVGAEINCTSEPQVAQSGGSHLTQSGADDVQVEHLIMEFVRDAEMTIHRHNWQRNCDQRLHNTTGIWCQFASSTQEFYFRDYWSLTGLPDLIFYSATHVHEAMDRTSEDFRRDFTWLMDLISKYVLQKGNTTLVYADAPRTNPTKLKPPYPFTNEYISSLNKVNADVLKAAIEQGMAVYPFYDLFSMSAGRMDLSLDGIHLKPPWYENVMSLFWATFCSE